MALPVKNRIVKEKDFEVIFNKGKTVKGSFLFIKFYGSDNPLPRFGFVVSKKTAPTAVKRNRLKRILSEKVKAYIKNKNISVALDVVVVVRRVEKEELLSGELIKLLEQIWKK